MSRQSDHVVFPIHDQNPTRNRAYLTLTLIGLNVLIFLFSPAVRGSLTGSGSDVLQCSETAYFEHWGVIPTELTHARQLPVVSGPPVPGEPGGCLAVRPSYRKNLILSTFTAQFVHAGWLHLAGNMLFLWVFGNNVEDRFGRPRFALFYVLSGVVASYAYAYSTPDSVDTLVGASGAIAGVLGAYLMLFPRAKVLTIVILLPLRLRAWVVLGVWFALQVINAQLSASTNNGGIGYLVHVVGFLLGVAYGLWFRRRHPPPPPVVRVAPGYPGI
jgi:membrane associated rhomboid family serine protease